MEVAPFAKLLYSSDAYGLAELYHLGGGRFPRRARPPCSTSGSRCGEWSDADARRIAALVLGGNAGRVYGIDETQV